MKDPSLRPSAGYILRMLSLIRNATRPQQKKINFEGELQPIKFKKFQQDPECRYSKLFKVSSPIELEFDSYESGSDPEFELEYVPSVE